MTFHGVWFVCLAIAYCMVSAEAFSNPLSPQQQQVFARIMLHNLKFPFLLALAVCEFAATFWVG
jgi:hypothetical protein